MTDIFNGRAHTVEVLRRLSHELSDKGCDWENDRLDLYLEALAELIASIENHYTNTDDPVPDNHWQLFSQAVEGARYYE